MVFLIHNSPLTIRILVQEARRSLLKEIDEAVVTQWIVNFFSTS